MKLPPRAGTFLWLTVGAAVVSMALWLLWGGRAGLPVVQTPHGLTALAELLVLAVVAQHFSLSWGRGHKVDLSLAAHLAVLLLAGPALGVAAIALSEVIGQSTLMLRRERRSAQRMRGPKGALFNASQFTLAGSAAGLSYGATTLLPLPEPAQEVLAITAAAVTMYVVNTALVATMVGLHGGSSPLAVWRRDRRRHAVQSAGLLTLGVLTAHTAAESPWVPVVMAVPAALIYVSLSRTAQAEAAVLLRDEFLGTAAHELRTPLTSLRGYAQLLAGQAERGQRIDEIRLARSLRTIDRQSAKLCGLIDQLLDMSRLESGRLVLEREHFDLAELARETAVTMQPITPGFTITVLAQGPVVVWADRLRLEQVLNNLVTNAARYAGMGDCIDLEVGAASEGTVTLAVRDYGVGIPEEHRERIFERFYQVGADSKAGGLGIGLFVTRQIVELHGGSVKVECPRDGGSRFTIMLPVSSSVSLPVPAAVAAALPALS